MVALTLTASASVAPALGKPTPPKLWYSVRAVRDLTGDGRVDTLTLEAVGRRPDSLQMTFRIRGARGELFRAEWSSYDRYRDFLDDSGKPLVSRDSLTQLVRSEMDAFFASGKFESAASLPFKKSWHVQGNGDDPRDYIAHEFQYNKEMATRKRRGDAPSPDNPKEWDASMRE